MMKRDFTQLAQQTYDLLVIGGGIHGACVAWDATLRGLSVALIDKGDFGGATSANSLKTVHGGLRYLQDADIKLMRKMIHERKSLLRIAPHLVHPLPCLMPTYGWKTKSKPALTVALTLNDLVAYDRNQMLDTSKHLAPSRVLSREECLQLLPGIADNGITGGALWHDGQMHNSERVLLAFVQSAVNMGACVANYVEAVDIFSEEKRVTGIRARDILTGEECDIHAQMVVNATGVWTDQILGLLGQQRADQDKKFVISTAMNIVTRQIIPDYAVGLPSRYTPKGSTTEKTRVLFVAPWRDYSIIGTIHSHYHGAAEAYAVSEEEIADFVAEINRAYPGANLTRDDVYFVHKGFLPVRNRASDDVKLLREGEVHDHAKEDGIAGLISVVGVKYTSARSVAAHAVDLVFQRLGRAAPPCLTDEFPLHGGKIEHLDDFVAQVTAEQPYGLSAATTRHLIYAYGSEYSRVLAFLADDPTWGEPVCSSSVVIKAEVLYSVRHEMAQTLADVILRRTELGTARHPGEVCLQTCAAIMAAELGWDAARVEQELVQVRAAFPVQATPANVETTMLVEA